MSSFKTFDSVANGNPLSSISSNSYQKSYFLVNIIKRQHGVPLLHLMAGVINMKTVSNQIQKLLLTGCY